MVSASDRYVILFKTWWKLHITYYTWKNYRLNLKQGLCQWIIIFSFWLIAFYRTCKRMMMMIFARIGKNLLVSCCHSRSITGYSFFLFSHIHTWEWPLNYHTLTLHYMCHETMMVVKNSHTHKKKRKEKELNHKVREIV